MNRWVVASIWMVVGSGLVGAGCGGSSLGSSAPPSCAQQQPCGGDVVGSWVLAGACVNAPAQNQELTTACPGAAVSGENIDLTGSLTFNADMTYTATNWHETFTINEVLPLSCSGNAACTDNNGTITDNANGSQVSITTSCSGTTTCQCHDSGMLTLPSETASYTLSGTSLQLLGTALSGMLAYCVEGDRLHLIQLSATTTDSTGRPAILSDIVAQKQ